MTDNNVGAGGPMGPPWSVDVLADLHAGLLPEAEATRLWPRVNADAQARAVLEALDSVRSDLNVLGTTPAEPMPAQYAARLDAAIQTEMRSGTWLPAPQHQLAPVASLDGARKRRNRRLSWGIGVFAAAAAALAVTVAVLPSDTTSGNPQAQISSDSGDSERPPLALSGPNPAPPISEFAPQEGEQPDFGPFGDEEGLLDCLESHDIEAGDPIGAREVTLDGEDGVGALVGAGKGGKPGQFLLVIVTPDCSEVMGQSTIGR